MSKTVSTLDQVLIDTIQKASTTTGEIYDAAKGVTVKAVDFASAQIPDIIHQLLVWKLAEACVLALVGILMVVGFFVARRKFEAYLKAENEGRYYDDTPVIVFTIFGGVILVIGGSMATLLHLLMAIKIIVAPKLFLLEYAAELLK